MEVKQIASIMNTITGELIGKSDIVAEDLSNVVDVGKELFNATDVDNYVKSLVNQVGKIVFVSRPYRGGVPSVLMDAWEFGSVVQKISSDLPEATENESWELQDKKSYDVNVFYKPKASSKFFNSRVTFEIPMSFTEMQVKDSFQNATQLNAFISMLYNEVDKSMTVKIESLVMRTINNFIANVFHHDFSSVSDGNYSGVTSTRAVNLLKLYNDLHGTTLKANECLSNADFIKYATYVMGLYIDRIQSMSTLFNIGGKAKFTPSDMLHVILLSDFSNASKIFLQSNTFNEGLVSLPNHDTVPYWQGSGDDYSFSKVSDIHVNIANGDTTAEVNASGILGVMFDRDALGVCNQNKRVTSNYNPKAEFFTNWFKCDSSYFNDFNENFIVFFVA
jgi:hypothetical protein